MISQIFSKKNGVNKKEKDIDKNHNENICTKQGELRQNSKKSKIIKRIGTKAAVKAFCQEFQIQNPSYLEKQDDSRKEREQNDPLKQFNQKTENRFSEIRKFTAIKSLNKNPLQQIQNRKLKRIGRKVWVTAYKQQINNQPSLPQHGQQMNLLEVPLQSSSYCNHLSKRSGSNTTQIYSNKFKQSHIDTTSYDDLTQFHEEALVSENTKTKEQLDCFKQNKENSIKGQTSNQNSISKKLKKESTKEKSAQYCNQKISKEQELNELMKDLNQITQSYSVTSSVKLDQMEQKDLQMKQEIKNKIKEPRISVELARKQFSPSEMRQDKIINEYEQKISKYQQFKRSEVKLNNIIQQTDLKDNSDISAANPIKIFSKSIDKVKKKKNSIMSKPLPPAYPFNEANKIINSTPFYQFSQASKKPFNTNKLEDSVKMCRPQFQRNYNLTEAISPQSKKSPSKYIQKSNSLKNQSFIVSSLMKNSANLEKKNQHRNSKSLHQSLHKKLQNQNKQKRFEINRYLKNAKSQIQKFQQN